MNPKKGLWVELDTRFSPGRTGRGPGRPAHPRSRGRSAAAEANRPLMLVARRTPTVHKKSVIVL